jgi:hypothetical protein
LAPPRPPSNDNEPSYAHTDSRTRTIYPLAVICRVPADCGFWRSRGGGPVRAHCTHRRPGTRW